MHRTNENNTQYVSNGVTISPSVPSPGDTVKITYDGLLSKNGASHIFAHVGFGNKWNDEVDIRMSKSPTGFFEVCVPVQDGDTLNLAFKDCAENWDNNSGKNYIFDVTQ